MRFFSEEVTSGKQTEILVAMTKEEGKKMIKVYEEYVKDHPRQTKVKKTYETLYHALPVW